MSKCSKRSWRNGSHLRALSAALAVLVATVVSAADLAKPAAPPASPATKESPQAPAAEKKESLDEQLLKGLPDDLLEGSDNKPAKSADTTEPPPPATGKPGVKPGDVKPAGAKPADPPAKTPAKAKTPAQAADNPADQDLLNSLSEGEDIGESSNPLVRIDKQMRTVEGKLSQGADPARTHDMQQRIVGDLDLLIKQLKQQQKQQQSSAQKAPGPGSPRGSINQPAQRGSPGGDGDPNSSQARNSSDKLHNDKAQPVDMAEMKKLLNNLWGDLPDKERETLINSAGERFLPKYELDIEKYFRQLGEAPSHPPGPPSK
ncbi:MAG TPA: hypothetical protein VFE24_07540 [Pirellulales bacterium]|nr:hypothetical protein [Pirellulales bacterium]